MWKLRLKDPFRLQQGAISLGSKHPGNHGALIRVQVQETESILVD